MAADDRIGGETARILLDIEAVDFRPDDPYIFTSGRRSPVYIDCRRLISFPAARTRVLALAMDTLERAGALAELDAIAGGETAGIPYAAWLAERAGLPMLYVRKQPKGFGRMAQIEGDMAEGTRVLLVEDLATDGGSKRLFIDALRAAGAVVRDVFVVFHYGIFPAGIAELARMGVRLIALASWADVLAAARAGGDFAPAVCDRIAAFLDDPEGWARARDG